MYKEIILCFVIIISVIIVNNISQKYTDKIIEEEREQLNEIKKLTIKNMEGNEDTDSEILEKSDKLLNEWKKQYFILALYLEHDELEKVQRELISLKAKAEAKKIEETMENIEMGIFALEHLKDKEVLNADNFF